jgi:hypothetical protein
MTPHADSNSAVGIKLRTDLGLWTDLDLIAYLLGGCVTPRGGYMGRRARGLRFVRERSFSL